MELLSVITSYPLNHVMYVSILLCSSTTTIDVLFLIPIAYIYGITEYGLYIL